MTNTGKVLEPSEFLRLANNFYCSIGMTVSPDRYNTDTALINYVLSQQNQLSVRKKVALVWICLNPPYWQYAKNMIEGAKNFFLPGHDVEYLLWTDLPETQEEIVKKLQENVPNFNDPNIATQINELAMGLYSMRQDPKIKIFSCESIEWPYPTLMRYHLFLQEEELLSKYDYIFYSDVDMAFVNIVGDEVLGDGITAALHPGYAIDKKFWPPYEPNQKSAAYIPRPGKVIVDDGKQRFMPMYFAGGFQGGVAAKWVAAMKTMREMVDHDLNRLNYIPIWNEESIYNRYLFDNPPSIVLTPSYIYPDSLIDEYYLPLWGVAYPPKLVTLTKKFTTSAEGGAQASKMIDQLKAFKK